MSVYHVYPRTGVVDALGPETQIWILCKNNTPIMFLTPVVGSNSGPHAYMANASPTGPSPQPLIVFLFIVVLSPTV